jgi:hypothetical protein
MSRRSLAVGGALSAPQAGSSLKPLAPAIAIMCPALSTRHDDRWPRWGPRSRPKHSGGPRGGVGDFGNEPFQAAVGIGNSAVPDSVTDGVGLGARVIVWGLAHVS